ncbi:MAG: circularly permuted type 2 ATP-grasp protein [Propionibacteriaceae bacterium]|nr:circularly permuted type 2 ATP-grasp protein [Propionibacteriaceae bacterium]
MAKLFEGYETDLVEGTVGAASRRRAYDEMFVAPDEAAGDLRVRPPYKGLARVFDRMSLTELRNRADAIGASYLAQGVTFDYAGEERAFPLDAVPRIVSEAEWVTLEAGIKQRVQVLEDFLDDVYGHQNAIRDGVIPASVVVSSPGFLRQAVGIVADNGVRVHVSGIDLIRDEQGQWRVLEDNVRVPSGVSYVMSNRDVMTQTVPELFRELAVRDVDSYPSRLLAALRASAPAGVEDPVVVVLTPGVFNSAYFEHTLLARLMGVELVEGRDLFCSNGYVMMRTTEGPQRVDVIYRRVDDEFLDPLQFRSDSVLGAPSLLTAARLGHVSLANGVGNGVADDKLVYTYMPDLTRYYLGQDPIIPNVQTWRLEEPDALEEVLDRLAELVVKPVDGSGGKGLVVGNQASWEELDQLRATLIDNPRGWIAQPIIQLGTIPTLIGDGLHPRHSDLRPFAVNSGDDIWVLPGGLTRVALARGRLVVNSSQGGGSKDTWVLGGGDRPSVDLPEHPSVAGHRPPKKPRPLQHLESNLDDPARYVQQQQHQQQQQMQQRRQRRQPGRQPEQGQQRQGQQQEGRQGQHQASHEGGDGAC